MTSTQSRCGQMWRKPLTVSLFKIPEAQHLVVAIQVTSMRTTQCRCCQRSRTNVLKEHVMVRLNCCFWFHPSTLILHSHFSLETRRIYSPACDYGFGHGTMANETLVIWHEQRFTLCVGGPRTRLPSSSEDEAGYCRPFSPGWWTWPKARRSGPDHESLLGLESQLLQPLPRSHRPK